MSVHLFQQWITDVYKHTRTGYAYIINKKLQIYKQPCRQRVGQSTSQTDICLTCVTNSLWIARTRT